MLGCIYIAMLVANPSHPWSPVDVSIAWLCWPFYSNYFSGHAALALDEKKVAISNLGEGVDVHFSGRSHPDLCLKNRSISEDRNLPLQVSFVLNGLAIICGSSDGRVPIWAASSGECLQLLEHRGKSISQYWGWVLISFRTHCAGHCSAFSLF